MSNTFEIAKIKIKSKKFSYMFIFRWKIVLLFKKDEIHLNIVSFVAMILKKHNVHYQKEVENIFSEKLENDQSHIIIGSLV